jgi:hypothetical protein
VALMKLSFDEILEWIAWMEQTWEQKSRVPVAPIVVMNPGHLQERSNIVSLTSKTSIHSLLS